VTKKYDFLFLSLFFPPWVLGGGMKPGNTRSPPPPFGCAPELIRYIQYAP